MPLRVVGTAGGPQPPAAPPGSLPAGAVPRKMPFRRLIAAGGGMGEHYVYNIRHLTKHYGKKEVLKDIYLSFYPGAKIGVLGSNGAGKSTLLRIMAGVDKDFMGEAWPHPGTSVGYVPQEPRLTPNSTVMDNIEEAVAPIRALLKRQEEIGEEFS